MSSISVAFQSSATLRAISVSHAPGCAGDELERLVGPVARHLRRRERPPERALGQLGGVLALVFRRAAAEAQRLIGAVGRRVVADVEVRPELRRRDVEAAADVRVARGDRHEHDREPGEKQRGRERSPFGVRRSTSAGRETPQRG